MEILSRLPVKSLMQFKLVSKSFNSLINKLELIMNILSRLPVKSLMRFKLVSKSFNSLISDKHFACKLHLPFSARNANPPVIFWESPDADADISILPVKSLLKNPLPLTTELETLSSNWKHPYTPIGSCNGLVCLMGTHEQFLWLCFWNPATRSTSQKWFTLRLHKPNSYLYEIFSGLGFGYDHVSDTYKVLFVCQNQEAFVFNMGDTYWRRVVSSIPPYFAITSSDADIGVYFNGTLNWLTYEDQIGCDVKILSFDLNKEEFERFLAPTMPYCGFFDADLGVLGECLCVSIFEDECFTIWQMKEFGIDKSWTKLLNFYNVNELLDRDLPTFGFPLYMFDNGDVLVPLEDNFYMLMNDNDVRDHRVLNLQFLDNLTFRFAMDAALFSGIPVPGSVGAPSTSSLVVSRDAIDAADLGKLHYFLDIEVVQSAAGISISQKKYVKEILDNFERIAIQ
ncbi:F-box/kelch-repeat protein At3g23880-like [Lotus japonicus]|uniref:F-box/kelch-repeat protein At3g23880-like n=1 Tax=Lotus japonicus TaxID=34305 RepID=UPI0025837CC3|nr:F-box/kelch-repeat protein At3g23880-like [Lotus japonicus]